MESLKAEKVSDCALVKTGYDQNGHDCWGNLEWSEYKYVHINGKQERVYSSSVIIHDGKDVLYVTTDSSIEFGMQQAYKELRDRAQHKLTV